MIKKKNRAFQMLEVVLVLLTVVTHWLIFYFILINSFKTKTEAFPVKPGISQRVEHCRKLYLYFSIWKRCFFPGI